MRHLVVPKASCALRVVSIEAPWPLATRKDSFGADVGGRPLSSIYGSIFGTVEDGLLFRIIT